MTVCSTPPRHGAEPLPGRAPSHEKERQTQRKRLAARAVEAYRDGVLLPSEVMPRIAGGREGVEG